MMRAFQNQSPKLKRGLGLLLLIFIVYGTTVEAAHRHGRVVPPSNPAATSFDKTGNGSTSPTTQQGCSDCLICQLHQNFSATLISVKPLAEPLVRQSYTPQLNPVSIRSTSHRPQSGRAPPQVN
jgi:hypothetical protein